MAGVHAQVMSAAEVSLGAAGGRRDPGGRGRRALGGAVAGQDVRAARDGAPAAGRRPGRGGWPRSARCRSRAATRTASGCCPTRPTRWWPLSTRRCARRTGPPRSSTRTSPRRAARGRPRSRWRLRRLLAALAAGARVRRRCAGCSASGPTAAAGSPTRARAAGCPTWRCPTRPTAQLRAAARLPHGVRPGDAGAPGPVAGHVAGVDRRSSSSAPTSTRSTSTGSRRGCWRGDTAFEARRAAGGAAAAVLRRLPGRVAAARAAVPGPGRRSGRWPAAQAGNYPVLLLDGVVGGVWHQKRSGQRVAVTVEPLGRLTRAQRAALDDEVERIGAIVDARPELTVGRARGA